MHAACMSCVGRIRAYALRRPGREALTSPPPHITANACVPVLSVRSVRRFAQRLPRAAGAADADPGGRRVQGPLRRHDRHAAMRAAHLTRHRRGAEVHAPHQRTPRRPQATQHPPCQGPLGERPPSRPFLRDRQFLRWTASCRRGRQRPCITPHARSSPTASHACHHSRPRHSPPPHHRAGASCAVAEQPLPTSTASARHAAHTARNPPGIHQGSRG